jgi:transposase
MAQHPGSYKERLWLERIRLWRQTQLSVRAFCRRRRLSEPSFYTWRRVLRERGLLHDELATAATPVFMKFAVNADAAALPIDLVLADGRIVRVRPGFDPDLLRQLLRLLEEPS